MSKYILIFMFISFYFFNNAYSQVDTNQSRDYKLEEIEILGKLDAQSRAFLKSNFDEIDLSLFYSFEKLASKISSGKLQQNSRGEYHLQLRTLSERQYAIYIDGARQTSLWDNRIDLNVIPALAFREIKINRFAPLAIWGPNNLGATVKVETNNPIDDKLNQKVAVEYLNNNSYMASYVVGRKFGPFSILGSVGYNDRKEFELPEKIASPYDDKKRFNSDNKNFSYLLKSIYDVSENFSLNAIFNSSKIEKGVPPEIGVPSPIFWRYPYLDRYYFSFGGRNNFETSQLKFNYQFSILNLQQKIRAFKNQNLNVISDEEISSEYTYGADILAEKIVLEDYLVKAALSTIYTDRDEKILKENYKLNEYAQGIYSIGIDAEKIFKSYSFNFGVGYDFVDYVKTADKPKRPDDGDYSLNAGFAYKISAFQFIDAGFGRKTRFPNLRESFSGALGKFVPNPDLKAEKMNSLTIGHRFASANIKTNSYFFVHWLKDGIARISLPGGKFQRVNKDEILSYGIENISSINYYSFEFKSGLCVSRSRAKNEKGEFADTLEYKPDFIADVETSYFITNNFKSGVGAKFIYNDFAIDPNNNRFVRLSNNFNLYANLSYKLNLSQESSAIFFVELQNILNRANYYQFGLPEPGREFKIGVIAMF